MGTCSDSVALCTSWNNQKKLFILPQQDNTFNYRSYAVSNNQTIWIMEPGKLLQEAGEPVESNDLLFSTKAIKPFNQRDTSVYP